jgi:hypothetical protein
MLSRMHGERQGWNQRLPIYLPYLRTSIDISRYNDGET